MRLQTVRYAQQFFPILGRNGGPQGLLRNGAHLGPTVFDIVRRAQLDGSLRVLDFRCQEISVLKPDCGRRALQVNENPTRFRRVAEATIQTAVGIRLRARG